jgi:hypothetical protein
VEILFGDNEMEVYGTARIHIQQFDEHVYSKLTQQGILAGWINRRLIG